MMIRVQLPAHLRTLAKVEREVTVTVDGPVTQRSILDALEAAYPVLRGTIRDRDTGQRRSLVRFFACEQDLSHESPDVPMPNEVAVGSQPFIVVGAMAGGCCGDRPGGFQVKYMMLVYHDEDAFTDETRQACYVESIGLSKELAERGKFLGASPLQPISTATSVRVREGKRLITDGPFAETREQLGGYFLIEAADLDEALEIAARIPVARLGTIEVRPLVQLEGIPGEE